MQIHDKLILEVPQSKLAIVTNKLPKLMKNIKNFKVSLVIQIGIGQNWSQAH